MNRIWLLGWLLLGACANSEQPALLEENSDTRLLEVQSALSPEEQARLDKIANRTLLQEIVDQAPAHAVQRLDFACSAQSGGVVAQVRKGDQLRGLRFSLAQANGGRSTRWYYQNKSEAVLVAHEQSSWQDAQERVEQTVFYLDGSSVLQVLHRKIQAHPDRLENALATSSFEVIKAADKANLWAQLLTDEQQLLATTNSATYHNYFCP